MKTSKLFVRLAYIYAILPIFIFVTSWCNLPTACIGGLIILVSGYFTCKNAPSLWSAENADQKRMLIFIALISLVWVYLSGIGALVYQNSDHSTRNPMFEHLVRSAWPIMLETPSVILTYYIGFWLPSALVGKIAQSVPIGFYAQVVWATLGVFLFFYLLLASLKRKTYWPILLFIFFSGLDAIGCLATSNSSLVIQPLQHMEWWYPHFQFSSFTTQLFWVFNQALPTWVIVMLMYHEKNNKSLLFLYVCLFLQGTLPAIGLFPFVVYWYFKNGQESVNLRPFAASVKKTILGSFSFQNTAGLLCVVLITFSYLAGNIAGGVRNEFALLQQTNLLHWLLIFFLPEVGLYLLCLWHMQRKNALYYICLGCFLIYPFLTVGDGPDFCMRATLPALVVLFVMLVQTLENQSFRQTHRSIFYTLIVLLGVGALTPIHELTRTIYLTRTGYEKPTPRLYLHLFFAWKEGNLFVKYFGK